MCHFQPNYAVLLYKVPYLVCSKKCFQSQCIHKIPIIIWRDHQGSSALTQWLTSAWSHPHQNFLSQTVMVMTCGTQATQSSLRHQAVASATISTTCHMKTLIFLLTGGWVVETTPTSWTFPLQLSLSVLSPSQPLLQYHPKPYSILLFLQR